MMRNRCNGVMFDIVFGLGVLMHRQRLHWRKVIGACIF
jgi:hypothetical protein